MRAALIAEVASMMLAMAAVAASASIFLALARVPTLHEDTAAALCGVVFGILLYQLIRVVVLHSGWPVFDTEVAQSLAKAVGLQSRRPAASSDPSRPSSMMRRRAF